MIRSTLIVASLLIATPTVAYASVRISEVAWMGSADNANAEWIELYNDGGETSLAGWTLTSSTGAPNITLSGTLLAQSFFLLTRTSVTNIPGVTGDQAYTGALSNTGATLTLTDGNGAVIDEVIGGTNWEQIGGDNTTKKTPQRGGSGWVTATPTPKAPNAEILGEEETGEDEVVETASTTPTVTIGGLTEQKTIPSSLPKLYILAGQNRIVSAHAETPYQAYVFDEEGKARKYADVSWSFGDGSKEMGREVRHTYTVPGTYLVVVRAKDDYASTLTTLTVEVVESSVSVSAVTELGIEVANNSENALDLSGWHLKIGGKKYRLPEDTALLPQTKVTFPYEVTKLNTARGDVSLLFPGGQTAALFSAPSVALLSEREVVE